MSDSLQPHGLYSSWSSPGQNTRVGSHSLLQGIFPTQGSNPGFLHCRWILYQLSHQGSPRILEWVAYPFSSRSSRPRNRIRASCIVGGFFTSWKKEKEMATHSSILAWRIMSRTRVNDFRFTSSPAEPPGKPEISEAALESCNWRYSVCVHVCMVIQRKS